MAAPSGQPKYRLPNACDGLRIVLPTTAATGQQVHPRIMEVPFDGLVIAPHAPAQSSSVLPTPAATGQQVHPRIMEAPFDGLVIAPHAPAQSSSGMEQLPYDVFINHHGGDAKHTIASSIYNKLDATGLRVFLDKYELKTGDFIPEALKEAMSSSPIHIAIFSKNYAQSPWCLAELAFILQLPNIKFIPIFYHVEPSTLRWAIKGKGIYGEALTKPEMESRYTAEKLGKWELALHKASLYTGEIISNEADEEAAVTKVVNLVLKELKKMRLDVAKHPVGLDELEQDFHHKMTALQSAAAPGPVQMVGIWGMGGAGKTTLAKHLFNKKSLTFGRSSFLPDVREAARKELLHEKQKELLKDLDLESGDFKNVDKGKEILRSRLRSVSVLIVLDDVDHTDQLDALLPARESLGHGSLIIVTTREFRVLKAWGISTIYKIRALNATHAQQLFCWHAFGQPSPLVEFDELAQKFINACDGLPLSLKVLGGLLCGESSKNYWHSQFDKLSRLLPDDIKSRLRISYDALDKEEKEMFLDIACFFIGRTSSRAIAVWDGSEWNGLHGWHRLVNKCLVDLDEKNRIRMHDHLRDLGREIANQHSPYRLWSKGQIIEIQPQQAAVRVRGMAYAFGENCCLRQGEVIIKTNQGDRSLQPGSLGLKILIGGRDFINKEYGELAKELVCLVWYNFQYENLPSWLSLKNLRILELRFPWRLKGLWERDTDAPLALKELLIYGAYNLKKIESFKSLRSLEGLEIHDCPELDGLASLAELTSLKKFELIECHKLEKIEGLESLISLETLVIDDCTELNTLLNLAGLTSLQKIELNSCNKLKKIESLKSLRSLEGLEIYNCPELDGLESLVELTSLKKFELIGCHKLEKIEGLESLISLETLKIKDCTELNTLLNLAGLTSLQKIELESCNKLDGLASLAELTSLKKFKLTGCHKLEKIEGLESLISLETLKINDCTELDTLPSLSKLGKLEVHPCLKAPPLRVNTEQRKGFKSLVVATNDISVVEPIISEIQTWPREVIICTRAVIDAGSLKNFFTSFPLKNVVEFGSFGGLKFSWPKTSVNANAILLCFNIDYVCPTLDFHIVTNRCNRFYTKLTNGKWVWMGVFREGSVWLQSNRFEIWASSEDKDVKMKEGWLVMGEEGSILKAFHRLSQS